MKNFQKNYFFLVLLFAFSTQSHAEFKVLGSNTLAKDDQATMWVANDPLFNPESAYFDEATNLLCVSNVNGDGTAKDGNGTVVCGDTDFKKKKWTVKGLNAPKGMRSFNGTLWVSDIDELVAIDMKTGKVAKKIKLDGAKFLNDVAASPEGDIFVSDTLDSKIYRIQKGGEGSVEVVAQGDDLESPNGLLVHGDQLIVAAWGLTSDFSTKTPGRLFSLNLKTFKKTLITKKPLGNLDGLEMDKGGNYLVSDWMAGKVFIVTPKGESRLLMSGMKGSADICYISKEDKLVVPRMQENVVSAYKLTKLLEMK